MRNQIKTNNKAFSLIELLAVIIVLGILISIAIPAINKYVVNSKKQSYIRTANVFIQAAREQYAKDVFAQEAKNNEALVIPASKIDVDKNKGYKSPYGKLDLARTYVIIERENGKNIYYFAAIDSKKYGINVAKEDELSESSVLKGAESLENVKSITNLKENNARIIIGGASYQLSNRNLTNSSTILLAKLSDDGDPIEPGEDPTDEDPNAPPAQEPSNATTARCFSFNVSTFTIEGYYSNLDGDIEKEDCPKDVIIPEKISGISVNVIGDSAFKNKELTSVTLPDSVTSIAADAFSYNNLETINLSDNVLEIENGAFAYNNLSSILIPSEIEVIKENAFGHNQISSIVFNNVTTIEKDAFTNNQLTNLIVSDKVVSIGISAFANNMIATLVLSANLVTVGETSFANNQISNVNFKTNITTIGTGAFYSNRIEEATIPSSVTTIGDNAFALNMTTSTLFVNKTKNSISGAPWGAFKVVWLNETYEYAYTGNYQEFTVPATGYYNIELWGAEGGTFGSYTGGKGAYTKGAVKLQKNEKIYIYVGGTPLSTTVAAADTGGYNGGGSLSAGQYAYGRSGGGATDVRLNNGVWNDITGLRSRIMVAAGGGGANYRSQTYGEGNGGSGGGLIGISGESVNHTNGYGYTIGTGGTQNEGGHSVFSGGTSGPAGDTITGLFGYSTHLNQAGGGGGYYCGGTSGHGGAGGGSSFISGYAGVNTVTSSSSTTHTNNTIHYSGKYFTNGSMSAGVNTGNGKAKITFVGTKEPVKVNTKLDNVRYIKSCVNGSSSNFNSHWTEIQAIKDGVNIASGKPVVATFDELSSAPISRITDGIISTSGYTYGGGYQCVTIDLGITYDLDEIAIWHYWADGRKYYDNTLSVGSTNVSGTESLSTLLHNYPGTSGYAETSQGKRYSAYENIPEPSQSAAYAYTGNYQTFTAPIEGYYDIELWGAEGGTFGSYTGGKGAYTKGAVKLQKNEKIYIYVGGTPLSTTVAAADTGGYNGGGSLSAGQYAYGRSGGGATDVRLNNGVWNDITGLRSRIMVAAGGGGANYRSQSYGEGNGGSGGGLIGISGESVNHTNGYGYTIGTGGTQNEGGHSVFSGGTSGPAGDTITGLFGYSTHLNQAGGGGGYYCGGTSGHGGAGGGSSFISGYAGVNAVTSASSTTHTNNTIHYSGKHFTNGSMSAGVNTGNGKAKITFVGTKEPVKVNTKLDNVRYIKSCINSNTYNNYNQWVELQAVKGGINVAKGKIVVGTSNANEYFPYSRIVDGDIIGNISGQKYSESSDFGLQCVTVDLGDIYDLDEVALWHFWGDNRVYYQNTLSVGPSNVSGTGSLSTVLHSYTGTSGYAETSQGKRYSAWE